MFTTTEVPIISFDTVPAAQRIDYLKTKLFEEAAEVCQARPDGLLSELADLYEVMLTLAQYHGIGEQDIIEQADEKRKTHGTFAEFARMNVAF